MAHAAPLLLLRYIIHHFFYNCKWFSRILQDFFKKFHIRLFSMRISGEFLCFLKFRASFSAKQVCGDCKIHLSFSKPPCNVGKYML